MKDINEIEKDLNNISERVESIRKDIDLIISGIERKPEFEVGQWAAWENKLKGCHKHLFYITKITNMNEIYGNEFTGNPDNPDSFQCYTSDLLSVTPTEIESHLKKICDEKYIGKKVRCLYSGSIEKIINKPHGAGYDSCSDNFWMCGEDSGMKVYKQGIFAEIIPDKKKLPKTKGEFKQFIDDWQDEAFTDLTFDAFLDQYED